MLRQLWFHISKRRHNQFLVVLLLMIISSFAEMVTIGSVLPFLGILTEPDQVFQQPLMQPIINTLNISKPSELILPLTILFISTALLASFIRLTLLYIITRYTFALGGDLRLNIYKRTLYQDYEKHVLKNSSEVINVIIIKTNTVISEILSPVLTFINSIIVLVVVMCTLLIINLTVALSAFLGFGLLYWGIIYFTRKQLSINSEIISDQSNKIVKMLQEGLGGIRDIIINSSQNFYCYLYRIADLPLRRAWGNNRFISGSPRYVMEAIGMTFFAGIAYFVSQQKGGMSSAIPVLGALALGAQRLLPTLQQAYSSYSTIKGAKSSFQDVLNLLAQPLPEYVLKNENLEPKVALKFKHEIKLSKLWFRYQPNTPWVLKNINLNLKKGMRIGFIGTTGSGKSTLIDIIMGLLPTTKGEIYIDQNKISDQNRRMWQMNVAHVPQNIYLSDTTIEENIAFGIPKEQINRNQIKKSAQQAQIAGLIEGWEKGYKTFVGERGIRLSGGQRQRIGIARALYKKANVLIFDEATNALDSKTEENVMKSIDGLGKELTILMIAHRLTTLRNCDKIIRLDKGNIHQIGAYHELVK